MSRDSVAAWTLLVINIVLVAGFFIYIDKQDVQIARLSAERDSLKAIVDAVSADKRLPEGTYRWIGNSVLIVRGWAEDGPPDTVLQKPGK